MANRMHLNRLLVDFHSRMVLSTALAATGQYASASRPTAQHALETLTAPENGPDIPETRR
eukprot:9394609-Lingulodinium_polyedra.AAC.1